jgi:hypothetical protein
VPERERLFCLAPNTDWQAASVLRHRQRLNRIDLVTRIDRLARSIGDLLDIVRAVRARGCDPEGHGAADRHEHSGR